VVDLITTGSSKGRHCTFMESCSRWKGKIRIHQSNYPFSL